MTLPEYQAAVEGVPFGKRLPTAVYVYRGDQISLGERVDRLVAQIVAAFQVGPEFNVIKFRTDELKVSFLLYPRFFEDPHPVLRHAITIDLVRGKARHIDYADNPNPPILHRKDAFLPADHPKRRLFTALTEAEEAGGAVCEHHDHRIQTELGAAGRFKGAEVWRASVGGG
jgi:DNA phosphorothioation-associated putative methyltransferase